MMVLALSHRKGHGVDIEDSLGLIGKLRVSDYEELNWVNFDF